MTNWRRRILAGVGMVIGIVTFRRLRRRRARKAVEESTDTTHEDAETAAEHATAAAEHARLATEKAVKKREEL